VLNEVLQKYLKSLGMTISGEKSPVFQVVAKKDTWFIKNPEVKMDNAKIFAIDPEEAFRYCYGVWGILQEYGEKSTEAVLKTVPKDRVINQIHLPSIYLQLPDQSTK
jgi:hypothetical protein